MLPRLVVGFAAASLLATAVPHPLFRIPLPRHEPLRFIVVGDAGTGEPHLHNGIVQLTRQLHVDAILLVGDNIYPCGVESVDDPQWSKVTVNFADAGVPIYPILGNHDYGDPTPHAGGQTICGHPSPQSQVRATGKIAHWIFPARSYELQSPLADIFMIDSQPIASAWKSSFLGSETSAGEVGLLQSALAASRAHWKIVAGHHTVYSSGTHGFINHPNQRNLRASLLPVLKKYDVDLYVCGHDHDAELIGTLHHHRGQPLFLVAGDGAHSLPMHERPAARGEPPTIFPASFPPQPLVGFTLLEIEEHSLSITFYDGVGNKRSETYVLHDR